jgi:hypothetical protein
MILTLRPSPPFFATFAVKGFFRNCVINRAGSQVYNPGAKSGIAAATASWHNDGALAYLRHGIFLPV